MSERGASIAIVDDHMAVAEGVRSALLTNAGFDILAMGGTAEDARNIADRHRPDIMLMDLGIPGDVFGTIEEIAEGGQTRVVVFTADSDLDAARRALDAGALGLVMKGAGFGELSAAIQHALNDELYIARDVGHQVLAAQRTQKLVGADPLRRLSARESQIVGLLLSAKSNREIARTLALSEKTVKRYMAGLMQKMRVRSRGEMTESARKNLIREAAARRAQ